MDVVKRDLEIPNTVVPVENSRYGLTGQLQSDTAVLKTRPDQTAGMVGSPSPVRPLLFSLLLPATRSRKCSSGGLKNFLSFLRLCFLLHKISYPVSLSHTQVILLMKVFNSSGSF